ncbi:MAG TPA: hypothetical protein VFA03_13615 [Acetobacteraceae bacterium]|nr:hypothetical protein [Acetobacteraceae bacterium]
MTPDGLLTFLALVVAVYAVAAPVAKLRVRLEIRVLQIVAAVSAVSLTLYLEFFGAADGSFTSKDAAFLVVLGWMLVAWLIHRLSKLGPSSLPVLSKLVDELLVEERYAELLKLVEPHLSLIDQVSRRKSRLQRLHDWLAGLTGKGSVEYFIKKLDDDEKKRRKKRMPVGLVRIVGRLHVIVPSLQKGEKYAGDVLRSIYRAEEARRFMVEQRPYAAISLLRLERDERFEFSDRFFGDLIADAGSALYLEIREQQTTRYQLRVYPEHNRLLHFLFSDAENARTLGVWKPIGEYLLRRLDPAVDPDYVAYLNGPATHFEQEWWRDSTYVGIQFFRLMVTSAAHQGVEWHMWLYCLPLILKKLEENYDTSTPLVDTTAEFPTRGARLIYEIVDALGDFVKLAPDLPEGSPHRGVPDRFEHANGNIPVSAAIALGQCVRTIATSGRLGDRFAILMHECVLRDITDLPQQGENGRLRGLLIQSLVQGGDTMGRACDQGYGQGLATLLQSADHVLRYHARDYIAGIDAAYPDALPEHLRPSPPPRRHEATP